MIRPERGTYLFLAQPFMVLEQEEEEIPALGNGPLDALAIQLHVWLAQGAYLQETLGFRLHHRVGPGGHQRLVSFDALQETGQGIPLHVVLYSIAQHRLQVLAVDHKKLVKAQLIGQVQCPF
jgi:hypothetical protein